jgi:hypothetical protein
MQNTGNNLVAIDILIEPDQTMISKARAVNARLRENFPAGYELDTSHAPHITLLQRFVLTKDFDAVTTALTKVIAVERPTELQLKMKGYEYVIWGGMAVTVFIVELTPGLMRLHQKVIDAMVLTFRPVTFIPLWKNLRFLFPLSCLQRKNTKRSMRSFQQ